MIRIPLPLSCAHFSRYFSKSLQTRHLNVDFEKLLINKDDHDLRQQAFLPPSPCQWHSKSALSSIPSTQSNFLFWCPANQSKWSSSRLRTENNFEINLCAGCDPPHQLIRNPFFSKLAICGAMQLWIIPSHRNLFKIVDGNEMPARFTKPKWSCQSDKLRKTTIWASMEPNNPLLAIWLLALLVSGLLSVTQSWGWGGLFYPPDHASSMNLAHVRDPAKSHERLSLIPELIALQCRQVSESDPFTQNLRPGTHLCGWWSGLLGRLWCIRECMHGKGKQENGSKCDEIECDR